MVGINYTTPQVALNFCDTVGIHQYTNWNHFVHHDPFPATSEVISNFFLWENSLCLAHHIHLCYCLEAIEIFEGEKVTYSLKTLISV